MAGKKTGGAKFTPAVPLTAIRTRLTTAAGRGLALAGEHVLGESSRLVPLEEGTLDRSGTVSVEQKGLRAAVSYNTPYAVRQHEDLTLKHDEGRQAKYLETALTGNRQQASEIIAGAIRGEF